MNVLFVQPALPHYRVPFFSELQRRSQLRVEVWSDHQHKLFPFSDPGGAFRTVHCPEADWGPFVSQPAMHRAIGQPNVDVVVLTWNTRYLQLLPSLLEARLRGRPVVLWGHGYSKHHSHWKHQARNLVGRLARACVTYSEPTRQRLIAEGLPTNSTFCAPNALDGEPLAKQRQFFLAHAAEHQQQLSELGVARGKLLLFVSRLEPDKRVGLLLDAFARVVTAHPDASLVLVGGGSEFERLSAHAERLHLGERVRFLGPIYDERTLGALFCAATAFVYPVAVGLSIMHALNYGLPVITSDDPNCHNPEFDVLVPESNCLLYHHEDVTDLARQIERLLSDPGLQLQLATRALDSVTGPGGRTLGNMVEGMTTALRYALG